MTDSNKVLHPENVPENGYLFRLGRIEINSTSFITLLVGFLLSLTNLSLDGVVMENVVRGIAFLAQNPDLYMDYVPSAVGSLVATIFTGVATALRLHKPTGLAPVRVVPKAELKK